ncbi:Nif3-like dinuclear metal center hexameric protein [Flavobacterium selenitireducens]|uniref:Nif3-like dinuclear metal center hexameric protein n=1 Tax=Flavobacterium selenitireducens TaxID=2722704 RepID=UPI00168C06B4|nr:Nif3-like dinuclear metal center hexameric protein [Flavobacterium selenitireducens]MBD3582453.1 Nif3-like dinuclear metal center hexameric protein [Flavobacterium selenitireducens]
MKIKDIIAVLDEMAPLAYAEDFDNVGLLVGDRNAEAKGVLVCHDALEQVIDEAIRNNCNLVVCFHPILFSGLKKITGANYVERSILKAIKNDIAIYAVHTALDNHKNGVNKIFCDALGLVNTKILVPKKDFIRKLVTFAPVENADAVRNALFAAGAGKIGNYENCSFNSEGIGTYQGNSDSNPVVGQKHEFVKADETKIEVTFESYLSKKILDALFVSHPYEEVAYEIYDLRNELKNIGLGMIGELKTARTERDFLQLVKDAMQAEGIRHSQYRDRPVKKVAVLGGSGSFAISAAKRAGADAFVTSDLKYHQFYEAENELLLLDIGHFESERFTKNYMVDFLKEKIPNFAIILSEVNTNPVKYF